MPSRRLSGTGLEERSNGKVEEVSISASTSLTAPEIARSLIDVLSWGEQVGLIGSGDRLLLSSLVEQTDRLGVRTVCRSGQGLMSAPALAETAAEVGLSPGTVRRRARRSIDALASACRSGRFEPSI